MNRQGSYGVDSCFKGAVPILNSADDRGNDARQLLQKSFLGRYLSGNFLEIIVFVNFISRQHRQTPQNIVGTFRV